MNRLLCILLFSPLTLIGQVFHFDQDSTALIKDVTQSPAHWYLEIFNDTGVDTTLRWKCHYSNIPSQWNCNFDDQNMFYPTVLDGDSADFTLYSGLSFPQKLIIGAAFNSTPGVGSYFFDIYDPETPNDFVTIEYHYIVGQASLSDLSTDIGFSREGGEVMFSSHLIGESVKVFDFLGKCIYEGRITERLYIPTNASGLVYWIMNKEHPIVFKEISQF